MNKRLTSKKVKELSAAAAADDDDDDLPDMEFDKGVKIRGKIWHKLYK